VGEQGEKAKKLEVEKVREEESEKERGKKRETIFLFLPFSFFSQFLTL
jgi:hypothetical protein